MRIFVGVILPLLLQLPVCVWLIFGRVIPVPGGSFVPLAAMLLAPVLVLLSFVINLVYALRSRGRDEAMDWLFLRAMGIAMVVPLLLSLGIVCGAALLD